MGEVGLATRSMLAKRPGRPRSAIRSAGLTAMAPSESRPARRASRLFPLRRAAQASVADAPPSPPLKK